VKTEKSKKIKNNNIVRLSNDAIRSQGINVHHKTGLHDSGIINA